MKNKKKITITVQATTTAMILGLAGQANAIKIVGDADHKSGFTGLEAEIYGFARLSASYDIDEDVSSTGQVGDLSKINTGLAEDNEVSGFEPPRVLRRPVGLSHAAIAA